MHRANTLRRHGLPYTNGSAILWRYESAARRTYSPCESHKEESEPRPPMVLSSYRACFSDFSCFVEQRSCQKCLVQRSSRLATVGTFPLEAQVLKVEWDQAASYPACQDFDSARCSIGIDQEERARPIYQRALATQQRARARAVPKSKRVKRFLVQA